MHLPASSATSAPPREIRFSGFDPALPVPHSAIRNPQFSDRLHSLRHRTIGPLGKTRRFAAEGPVESAAEVRLGDLTRQFDQLGAGKMLLQRGEQLVAHRCGGPGHGNGKIENELFNRAEYRAFLIVRKGLQFLIGNASRSAVRRA